MDSNKGFLLGIMMMMFLAVLLIGLSVINSLSDREAIGYQASTQIERENIESKEESKNEHKLLKQEIIKVMQGGDSNMVTDVNGDGLTNIADLNAIRQ